ncbi:MAG: hypothetical protein NTZ48_06920, partial [Candidatus Omnitrophica bacterium]|nr:hypothetical protein [Candidatus Omnitrophota bacterium]
GKIDILLGTGLLATEPDLSGIDFLGVINLEQGMSFHDFRGQERVFWTLMSLAKLVYSDKGWGEMLIQSFDVKSIVIEAVKKLDYCLFYRHEITARRELKLPPFKELIILNLRGKDKKSVEDNAIKLFDILMKENRNKDIFISEPIPNPLPKLRDKFRWQVLIKVKNVKQAKDILCEIKVLRRRFRGSILTIDMELC